MTGGDGGRDGPRARGDRGSTGGGRGGGGAGGHPRRLVGRRQRQYRDEGHNGRDEAPPLGRETVAGPAGGQRRDGDHGHGKGAAPPDERGHPLAPHRPAGGVGAVPADHGQAAAGVENGDGDDPELVGPHDGRAGQAEEDPAGGAAVAQRGRQPHDGQADQEGG